MNETLRIGVAGLGTVGAAVLQVIERNADLLAARAGRSVRVVAVSARSRERDRGVSLDGMAWYDNPVAMAEDPDVDVVIELIGGEDGPAKALTEAALQAGKPVVTANKAMIAHHGNALGRLAEENATVLRFEAAVGGGIPIIKAMSEGLAGNRVHGVYGILNGTCNYILSEMEETGRPFETVLEEAQKLGYAEADPSFDVDGVDTAHKLSILASIAFSAPVDFAAVYTEGMRHITPLDIEFAAELGFRIKLMGIATHTEAGISQRVHPCFIDRDESIAHIMGVDNAIVAKGDFVSRSLYQGPGAGGGPTASAVVGDLIDIARGVRHAVVGSVASSEPVAQVPMDDRVGGYYMRLAVADRPGVMADIALALRDDNVSIEEMLQRPREEEPETDVVDLIMILHETREANMMQALDRIAGLPAIIEKPEVIRIESL